MMISPQTRRRFGGRQPLCGIGVTSMMLVTFMPSAFSERTADSRPGPGPLMRTSSVFTPYSCAARPAFSAATCAANGVDLREPRKPAPPAVAHDSALPWRSVIVTTVLLNEACTCTMASVTTRLAFFLVLATTGLFMSQGFRKRFELVQSTYSITGDKFFLIARRGPLRVRALV